MTECVSADFITAPSSHHRKAVSGVDSSPTHGNCEASQGLLSDLPTVFSPCSPISPHLSHMSRNNLEQEEKQNTK